ncbi:MAG: hypothetical protein MUC29_05290 [Pyrinomonadaceae bacterium]|nr:hypothetical protein [Pyrinomonadaceae bacterium]
MKKYLFLFWLLLFLANHSFSQEVYENKKFEFSINKPEKWVKRENTRLLHIVNSIDLTDENLEKTLKLFQGALLVAFQKTNPNDGTLLNPIIQVNIRFKPTKDFDVFKKAIINSANSFKQSFDDFEFIDNAKEIEISGIKSVYFFAKFTYKTKDGKEIRTKSRTYAIPYKNYFFQINFTDGFESEDCTKEFDELVKSIKIGK